MSFVCGCSLCVACYLLFDACLSLGGACVLFGVVRCLVLYVVCVLFVVCGLLLFFVCFHVLFVIVFVVAWLSVLSLLCMLRVFIVVCSCGRSLLFAVCCCIL